MASFAAMMLTLAPVQAEGLFPAPQGEQWGYIDRQGEWVVEPRFTQAEVFSEGRAAVFDGEKWGVIDGEGAWVREPFIRSMGRRTLGGQYRFVDPPISPFREGHAAVCSRTEGCYLIDRDGDEHLVDAGFHHLLSPSEGLVAYQHGRGMREPQGFLDLDGQVVIEARFDEVGPFSDGLAVAAESRSAWGYADRDGQWAIASDFRGAGPFRDGLAPVRHGLREWFYIDREGNVVIDGPFREAHPFSDGVALVEDRDRQYRFINTDGEEVLEEFTQRDDLCGIRPFHNGLARALLVKPGARGCGTITTGHGRMFAENGRLAYINREGEVVWAEG
ncbi:hypothetical protein B1C78_15235 [Thioalkalivibrio denitrificans]|uniref:WG repeat-containing protein n=1 Tax=Thioalkalivibrio denitrificans TaxID=108003 RepID=A0A1V3NB75_9GAMM|nr:WG repeat-containing protein [Thioalkalivibrio denitrificans]OOG22327.1 hypothetical protein B1C78_15235 [Thioalkalivibrio denitrificans]